MIEFIRSLIKLGTITRIDNKKGLLRAQIRVENQSQETIIYNNYGFVSNPPVSEKTIGINLQINGQSDVKYTLPFVADKIPVMQTGEACMYDDKENKIHIKENEDIDIISNNNINITGTGIITVNGASINLGDATSFGLNQNAVMEVEIPGGSSAGTYPVTIVNAGNNKVKL
jgi:phage gp45-like